LLNIDAHDKGDKRSGVDSPWQKVKFDRQIVAIGKVRRVRCIYSTDPDLKTFGQMAGIEVCHIADLQTPPPEPKRLPFPEPKKEKEEPRTNEEENEPNEALDAPTVVLQGSSGGSAEGQAGTKEATKPKGSATTGTEPEERQSEVDPNQPKE
jgi:hypothetical protein